MYGPITDDVKLEGRQANALREVLSACCQLVAEVEKTNAALPWSVAQAIERLDDRQNTACRLLMDRIDGSKLVPEGR